MKTYKTTEVATMIGIHPNTVRLYEKLELIPKPESTRAMHKLTLFYTGNPSAFLPACMIE